MKQAVQEGFILDVPQNYTPVDSYYRLLKKVEDDPEFDVKKAQRKLRHYVESHEHAVRQKAEIMVDHFHDHVLAKQKIGGQARAMVVTGGVERAIMYCHAIQAYLQERSSHLCLPCMKDARFTIPSGSRGPDPDLARREGRLGVTAA